MIDDLPNEPLEILRQRRSEVAPFIGAGLSPVASTSNLMVAVRERAEAEGVQVDADDLLVLTRQLADELGRDGASQLIATAVQCSPTASSPTLEVLARCTSRVIVTFNYDDAIERAILATGQTPRPLLPNTAEVFRDPPEGEVVVVHLHGSAHEPHTLVLPGLLTEVLNEDDVFKGALRHLWLRHHVVYLGFRLGPAETHLRAALGWLVNGIRDVNRQLMFLPRSEYESRGEELQVLRANPFFIPVPYSDTPDHRAVHFVALLIAPRNEPTDDVVPRRAQPPVPYFLPPQMKVVGEDADLESATTPEGTLRLIGDRLARARRVVVDGQGGMGKTQLLRALGASWNPPHEPLYAPLDRLAAILDDDEPITAGFARFVAHGEGFNERTPRPTLERLETGQFAFLLDGLDELAVPRRPAVASAVAEVAAIWEQHVFVVASRPIGVEGLFTQQGFEVVRLEPSTDWGRAYLKRRGVSDERINETVGPLGDVASEMIAVPMQAAHVGESLVRGMEVATRPIDFAVRISHDLVAREAGRRGWSAATLATGLERLAFALTFADVREASEEELAAICQLDVDRARLRSAMVEAGLLREIGESGLNFPTRTQREALAASLVLRSRDLMGLLLKVAVIESEDEVRPRPFLEQVLDWIWESAPTELQPRLFDLDPGRSLRVFPSEMSADLVDRALGRIWRSHMARDRPLSADDDRTLESLASALRVASGNHRDVVIRHRTVWEAATSDPRPAVRANAVFLLSSTDDSGSTGVTDWLRLDDDDRSVRLEALDAVARLKKAGTARLIWETLVRFPADRYHYAQAMIDAARGDDIAWVADAVLSVAASPASIERLLGSLDLPTAIQCLERARLDRSTAEAMAAGILGSWPVESWTGDLAERYFLAVDWPPKLRPSDGRLDEAFPGVADSRTRGDRLRQLREVFSEGFIRAHAKAESLLPGIPKEAVEFEMGRSSVVHRSHVPNRTVRPIEANGQEDSEAHEMALEKLPGRLQDVAAITNDFGLVPVEM